MKVDGLLNNPISHWKRGMPSCVADWLAVLVEGYRMAINYEIKIFMSGSVAQKTILNRFFCKAKPKSEWFGKKSGLKLAIIQREPPVCNRLGCGLSQSY